MRLSFLVILSVTLCGCSAADDEESERLIFCDLTKSSPDFVEFLDMQPRYRIMDMIDRVRPCSDISTKCIRTPFVFSQPQVDILGLDNYDWQIDGYRFRSDRISNDYYKIISIGKGEEFRYLYSSVKGITQIMYVPNKEDPKGWQWSLCSGSFTFEDVEKYLSY